MSPRHTIAARAALISSSSVAPVDGIGPSEGDAPGTPHGGSLDDTAGS